VSTDDSRHLRYDSKAVHPVTASRRLSSLPLPESRYLPSVTPRGAHRQPHPIDWDALDEAELWAYGVDLFNARYYWEAHDAWERLWRAALRGSPEFTGLKGLIQIAAALLKVQVQNEPAARRLASRGIALLGAAAERRATLYGLELESVMGQARTRLLDATSPLGIEQVAFELDVATASVPESDERQEP
jgi:hypothetical protein